MKTNRFLTITLFAIFASLFLTVSTRAAIYTVNSTADPGDGLCNVAECTLREAVNAANAAAGSDSVDFDPAVFNTARTITLTNGEIVITQSLNVQGPGAGLLTVSGNNNGRIFAMTTNNVDLTISGLTLRNGNGTGASNSGFGGTVAVFASGGSFTMNNVTVNNNTAANGGGIIVAFGIPATISNSTFSNNTSTGQGGAIQMQNGTMTITNSTFSNNTANINDPLRGGGAIRLTSGTLNVTSSTFTNNNAPNGSGGSINSSGSAELNNSTISGGSAILGGGIRNINTLTLNGVTVRNNNATSAGGGIANTDTGNATLNNSTVSGNTTVNTGGGIYNNNATLTLNNSTVSGNTGANFGGGGIRVEAGSTANLNSSTISDNSAGQFGGGISVVDAGSTATLNNTIIANSTSGGDCFNNNTVNASFSLIEDGLGCVNGTSSNNRTGDPNLGPLADNGGTTQTHALLAGSIAIDSGNSTETTDQRGQPRPVDSPNSANGAGNLADIGAFEMQAVTAARVSISGRILVKKGRGLTNALVYLTDQSGTVRVARSSAFGYYRFDELAAGQTVIITIASKRYQFAPQVVTLSDAVENLNFSPLNDLSGWRW